MLILNIKYRIKIFTLLTASVIFIVHFTLVLIYAFPLKEERTSKADYYAFWYAYPYFVQDWRLFTPCPDYNFRICVGYDIGEQKHYAQPLAEALHHHHLFNGSEFLTLTISNAAGYFAHNPSEVNKKVLKAAIMSFLEHKHSQKIEDLHILFELTEIKTNKVIHYYYE